MQVTSALRIGTAAGAVGLVLAISALRFCGAVSLPPKSAAPSESLATSQETLRKATQTEETWLSFVDKDAAAAGVPAPSREAMYRKLVSRDDEGRRALVPGATPVDAAGLRLSAVAEGRTLSLVIENTTDRDLAYHVVTKVQGESCMQHEVYAHNAQVIAPGGREQRAECAYRDGLALTLEHVETLELLPLQAYYVSRVPPIALGSDARLARGHEPVLPGGHTMCSFTTSQALRAAVESGEVAWRDLVDFYARHRCDTYRFPLGYRAFKENGEVALPAVAP
jgi:hypothetical protein